jgi:hypothetical protein
LSEFQFHQKKDFRGNPNLRYKAGIEKIEAAYNTLMKGSHNLKPTLDELKGFIFELNTENSQNLNMKKIKEYLELVRREKGKQAAEELGSYVVTVKAEYLITVSLHYSYVEDHKRVQREYEDFNRDAMEIIKNTGLADVYDGETRDGLKHGKGAMFYKSGNSYVGEWLNDKCCGHGHYKINNGNTYEGEFQNDKFCGQGKYTWADGLVHEGAWLNSYRHGHGHYKDNDGWSYEGEYKNNEQCGQGKYKWADGSVYEGACGSTTTGTATAITSPTLGTRTRMSTIMGCHTRVSIRMTGAAARARLRMLTARSTWVSGWT